MLITVLAGWSTTLLAAFFVFMCVFLTLIILIQKPKGGGLSGAFGGAGGGSGAVFGAKTGDVLTWLTVGAFVVFLFLGMGLVWSSKADHEADRVTPAPAPGAGLPTGPPGATPPAPAPGPALPEPPAPPPAPTPPAPSPEGGAPKPITPPPAPGAPDQP